MKTMKKIFLLFSLILCLTFIVPTDSSATKSSTFKIEYPDVTEDNLP